MNSVSSILRSVETYVKTVSDTASSQADSLLTQAKASINVAECSYCKQSISILDNLLSSNKCRMCCRIFCSKCIAKSVVPLPTTLLHESFRPAPTSDKKDTEEKHLICTAECAPIAMLACMERFKKEVDASLSPHINAFLANETGTHEFFPLPTEIPKDDALRQALRFVQIAEVIPLTGALSAALKAAKYAYLGTNIVQLVVAGDLLPVLNPLLESLKRFGLTGPTALIRLYYLGCQHTLNFRQRRGGSVPLHCLHYQSTQPGVLLTHCPNPVLDYISQYVSAAQWLYLCALPPPHDSVQWSAWFLSKVLHRQRWTLLACVNDSTKLLDGAKCPAFALMARCFSSSVGQVREALLVVRGSSAALDWSINFDDGMAQYCYFHLNPTNGEVEKTTDLVHAGMYRGAVGILDSYHLRPYLHALLDHGYHVRVVGHSLGAAVATMIAAELRSSRIKTSASSAGLKEQLARVSAVVYSCPAFLGTSLAETFLRDRLLVNVVHGSDPVPRFSLHTLGLLAEELEGIAEQADRYLEEDKRDLQTYLTKLGKAADIHDATADRCLQREEERKKKKLEEESKASATTITTSTSTSTSTTSVAADASTTVSSSSSISTTTAASATKIWSTLFTSQSTSSGASSSSSSSASAGESVGEIEMEAAVQSAVLEECKENSSASPDSPTIIKVAENDVVTVTPGPIVHIYRENNG
jgi:hypothetical protein